jgi:ribosomal protein L40E
MAKLCLNCGRSNHDRASTCKKCNASLGHALRMDAPSPSHRPLMLIGIVGILILVVVILNTFALVRF